MNPRLMTLPSTDRTIARASRRFAVVAAILALAGALTLGLASRDAEGAGPKNVVFILTDDQTAGELAAMPNTQALIGGQGATFRRAYASYPLCCPARAALLTGQYLHNHGVHGNVAPFGAWDAFRPHESNALPVWTADSGYYNVHIGKYMNSWGPTASAPSPVPPGWDEWYGKVSEGPVYFNYHLLEQAGPGESPEVQFYGTGTDDYQTDVFGKKATDFIDGADVSQQPFMMNVWFNAPHGPFEPAPRHLFSLSRAALPRTPGFNEKDISDKPRWLQKQARKRFGKRKKKTINAERLRRQEQLLSVDEAVRRIVDELRDEGLLDDTYIVFTSDNGFFRGEHRIVGGKYLPHDPSSKVPLLIRGPGIPAGAVSDELVSLTDLPATILDIIGSPDPSLDGRSLLPYAQNPGRRSARPILFEADTGPGRGSIGPESASASTVARTATAKAHLTGRRGVKNLDQEKNPIKSMKSAASGNFAPAYRAIRTDRYLYVLYANGQTELYDMLADPFQLRSLAASKRYNPIRKYLFNALVPLTTCAGAGCRTDLGPEPAPLPKPKPKKRAPKSKQPG
jgi:N-acetylglucosamine-6-sulfatase